MHGYSSYRLTLWMPITTGHFCRSYGRKANSCHLVKDSEVLPVKPGQEIRFPVEPKGRFEPIAVGGWLNEYTIGSTRS